MFFLYVYSLSDFVEILFVEFGVMVVGFGMFMFEFVSGVMFMLIEVNDVDGVLDEIDYS